MTNSNIQTEVNKMKSVFLGKLVNANNINDLVRISNQKTWKSLESNSRVRNKVVKYLNREIKDILKRGINNMNINNKPKITLFKQKLLSLRKSGFISIPDFQAYMNLINSRIRNEENKKYFFFY